MNGSYATRPTVRAGRKVRGSSALDIHCVTAVQVSADKWLPLKDGFNSWQQVAVRTRLVNIPERTETERFLYHVGGSYGSHEQYFCSGSQSTNLPGDVDPV